MCWRTLCCCASVVAFFALYTGYVIYSLAKELHGPEFLGELFNDGGCELVAEDLIRGGAHMQLWEDGVAIVSAGDFNTTFHHCAREARGVGLFAVDLKAQPKPRVRKLELEGWPEGEPPLVGEGLFFSNVSRRLYVVNHGGKEEEVGQPDAEYQVGDVVQAICCCCSWNRWNTAVVLAKRGGGSYNVQWIGSIAGNMDRQTDTTKHAREMRKPKLKNMDHYVGAWNTTGCPLGPDPPPGSEPMTEAECRIHATHVGQLGEPFVLFSDDEPSGCFLLNQTRHFNANPHGVGRRANRQLICKSSWEDHDNELKVVVATGQEEEGPESSVAVFELEGHSFETLRVRWAERVTGDVFPYHGIVDVVEGRGPDELYVLVTFAWRSTVHQPFLNMKSRNNDPQVTRNLLIADRWLRGLGLRSWARTVVWFVRNFRKTLGHHDFWDSPAGGDLGVVRCKRRPDADEGQPPRAGLRWECRMTRARGFPLAQSLAVSPDRSQLLVSVSGHVQRFRIDGDGDLTEVGQPLDLSRQGLVIGMHWDQGSILYSVMPANVLIVGYAERWRRRPGVPADLFVGAEPGSPGWFDSLWAPAPKLVLRHDGSLQGGIISSWLRYKGAVLAGSSFEEGLLYCRKPHPLPKQEFHMGDRVWALWDELVDWRVATVVRNGTGSVRVVWDRPGGRGPGGSHASSLPPQKLRSIPAARKAAGPLRVGDSVLALRVNSSSWERATVEQDHGNGNYTVTWEEHIVALHNIRRSPLRVQFQTAARQAPVDWLVDVGAPFREWMPGVAFGWTQEGGRCGQEGSGTCSPTGELTTWELRLAEGLYEVAVVLRSSAQRNGAAEQNECALEGLKLNATGAVVVRVRDGFLTLGGCRGLVESIDVRDGVEELQNAVPFFYAHMGRDNVIGEFEIHRATEVVVAEPPVGPLFLRRLPAGLHAENTTIVVTVRGGSCGPRAVVSFQPDDAILAYFQNGTQASWRPLERVRVLAGDVQTPPTWLFTGNYDNKGWILGSPHPAQTFASSYRFNSRFDLCNCNPLSGGELVTLSYVVGTPSAVREAPALEPGEYVWALRPVRNTSGVWRFARLQRRRDDGTFVVAWYGEEAGERVLPLERLQRSQETGYRRLRVGTPALTCGSYHSWTHSVNGERQCMRLCDARPLCRFVAYFPEAGRCLTSTACSSFEGTDLPLGSSSSIFQKLAPLPSDDAGALDVL